MKRLQNFETVFLSFLWEQRGFKLVKKRRPCGDLNEEQTLGKQQLVSNNSSMPLGKKSENLVSRRYKMCLRRGKVKGFYGTWKS